MKRQGSMGGRSGGWASEDGEPHALVPPAVAEGPMLRTDLTLCGLWSTSEKFRETS